MRETTALRRREQGAALPSPGDDAASAARPAEVSDEPLPRKRNAARPDAPAPAPPRREEAASPRMTPLARREARRIARDPESIDARLDLHGMRQREAYPALKGFLRASQARGHRLVLVITGKGVARESARQQYEAWEATPFYESPRGVLRRLVPEWLAKPEFRDVVAGVSPAHSRHGGEGALYVRIRRIATQPASRGKGKHGS
ncbi:Smr/MutS family protein [Dichotomicrobium thermohalophilum]|nr:Smr/MutS family protein [Dichotomicrobium thermohalophilum]